MNYTDPQQVPAIWQIGDVILGIYEIKEVFTGGGMGLVYRAYHRNWDIDLAVKCPRQECFATDQQVANFENEAETWVNLQVHPHVATCYYVRALGRIPRLFAEFVDGGSLRDWIRNGRLNQGPPLMCLTRVIDIAIQIAWGLHHGHENRLIHQDVKPGNILMGSDGTAKITDYGLANARSATSEANPLPRHGQSIMVPGSGFMTREYCSPEQARGEPLSRATDIWSWAVSVLEMLVGDCTWTSGLAAPHVLAGLEDEGLDTGVAQLLQTCLAENPQERPKSLIEAANTLTETMERLTERKYWRELPPPSRLTSQTAHNRAISLFDLKGHLKADYEIREVARKWPHQIESTFAEILLAWRSGDLSDIEAIKRLRDVPSSEPLRLHFEGLLHCERGAFAVAESCLERGDADRPETKVFLDRVRRLKSEEARIVQRIDVGPERVTALSIANDYSCAIVGNQQGALKFVSIAKGQLLGTQTSACGAVYSLCFHPSGQLFAAAGATGTIEVWDFAGRTIFATLRAMPIVSCVVFDLDGSSLFASSSDGVVRRWNVDDWAESCDYHTASEAAPIIAILPLRSRDTLLALTKEWKLLVWNINDAQLNETLTLPPLRDAGMSVRGNVARPQLAYAPLSNKVFVSDGWGSGMFDLTLKCFSNQLHTTGIVCNSATAVGICCEAYRFALIDAISPRIYCTLQLNPFSLGAELALDATSEDVWFEAPALSNEGTSVTCAVWTRAQDAKPGARGEGDRVELITWDIAGFLRLGASTRAPLPLCRPISTTAYVQNDSCFREMLATAEAAESAGDYERALAIIEEARCIPGYRQSGATFFRRWTIGAHLIQEEIQSVTQRPSAHLPDSFTCIPTRCLVLLQSAPIDDSTVFDFWPDQDGDITWSPQGVSETVNKCYGTWGAPRLLGYDACSDILFVERWDGIHALDVKRGAESLCLQGVPTRGSSCIGQGRIVSFLECNSALYAATQTDAIHDTSIAFSSGFEMGEPRKCVRSGALHPHQHAIVTAHGTSELYFWDARSRRCRYVHTSSAGIVAINTSGNGRLLIAACTDGTVLIYAMPELEVIASLETDIEDIKAVSSSANGDYVLVGGEQHLKLFEIKTSASKWEWEGRYDKAEISSDCRWILIKTQKGLECWECEWTYRRIDANTDKPRILPHLVAFAFSRLGLYWRNLWGMIADAKATEFRVAATCYLALIGVGKHSENQIGIWMEEIASTSGKWDGSIVFDDYDGVTEQGAFAFYWNLAEH